MAKKHIANLHAKNYVDAVFAQSLLDDGFVCPDDKSLCWYRVTNGETRQGTVLCLDGNLSLSPPRQGTVLCLDGNLKRGDADAVPFPCPFVPCLSCLRC